MPLPTSPSRKTETAPRDGPRTFRAPGRLTLIGERGDDNEGYVLPFATDLEIRVTATPRRDRAVRAHSLALRSSLEFGLDDTPEGCDEQARGSTSFAGSPTCSLRPGTRFEERIS